MYPHNYFPKIDMQRVSYLKRSLEIVWDSGRNWTIARWLITAFQSCIPITRMYCMKLLLDAITEGFNAASVEKYKVAAPLIVAMGAINLVGALLGSVDRLVSEIQNQKVSDHLLSIMHDQAVKVDLEYYENSEYYDIAERARSESQGIPLKLINRLQSIGGNLIQVGTLGSLLLFFDWKILALLVLPIFPRIGIRFYFIDEVQKWVQRRTATQRKAAYYNNLLTTDSYAKEIRLFDLGHLFKRRFRIVRQKLLKEKLELAKRRTSADFSTTILSVIAMWGAYAFIAYETVQGHITVGDLVLYNQSFRKAYDAIWSLLQDVAGLYEDVQYVSYLFEFLDFQPKIIDPVQPKDIPIPIKSGIIFEHVDFTYPGSQRQALTNISLTIQPGEVIALVGENGSGKTTVTKLLTRLYDPSQGRILIDGIDLRDLKVKELRQQISVIFQDYAKYDLTARENIWLGNIECDLDDKNIEFAAQLAGADEVIRSLPKQYDNLLGKRFEGGEELSIGQWQKVSIARAFLRNSQIIVLDEPTSALDPRAEYEIFCKFRELLNGQSAVLVTHRLSTVKMADCIYVLEHGHIVESGTHDVLISLDGVYANLFETQAKNYR